MVADYIFPLADYPRRQPFLVNGSASRR